MNEIKEHKLNEPSELAKASLEVNSLPEEELNAPIEELDNEMRERENILDYNLEHISFISHSQKSIFTHQKSIIPLSSWISRCYNTPMLRAARCRFRKFQFYKFHLFR
jgi:hypothetical protein